MSFTDTMSSARGLGVIGTLMALLVVVGFGFMFTVGSNEGPQGESQAIGAVMRRQGKSLERLRANLAQETAALKQAPMREENAKELARLEQENRGSPEKIVELEKQLAASRLEITRSKEALVTYKNDYRALVRGKAKGELMDKLVTRKGDTYVGVKILEVTAVGLRILHTGGLKQIRLEELDDALLERFKYKPE